MGKFENINSKRSILFKLTNNGNLVNGWEEFQKDVVNMKHFL